MKTFIGALLIFATIACGGPYPTPVPTSRDCLTEQHRFSNSSSGIGGEDKASDWILDNPDVLIVNGKEIAGVYILTVCAK